MTWENLYLTCFLSGLFLTAISFVFGAHLHLPMHVHLPGVHLHSDGAASSPFNLTTILVFITWFGACGYVVTHYNSSAAGIALRAGGRGAAPRLPLLPGGHPRVGGELGLYPCPRRCLGHRLWLDVRRRDAGPIAL